MLSVGGRRKIGLEVAVLTPTGSWFAATVPVVPAAVEEALVTSLNELEAFTPPPRLPLVTELDPVFSFVLEASDLESSWPALGFNGAMLKNSRSVRVFG